MCEIDQVIPEFIRSTHLKTGAIDLLKEPLNEDQQAPPVSTQFSPKSPELSTELQRLEIISCLDHLRKHRLRKSSEPQLT